MAKTYIVCVRIFKGSGKEYTTVKKLIKKRGFKKTSETTILETFKIAIAFTDVPEMNRYIASLFEVIDQTKIRVTTAFDISSPAITPKLKLISPQYWTTMGN